MIKRQPRLALLQKHVVVSSVIGTLSVAPVQANTDYWVIVKKTTTTNFANIELFFLYT